jgi:hypothetical protein
LRDHFITGFVQAERLELQIHGEQCCTNGMRLELCCRSDIYLFPWVASLFPDVGGALLSLREYDGLQSARAATFEDDAVMCKKFETKLSAVERQRILGYGTVRDWLEAGAYHLYFVSAGLNVGQKYY